MTRFNFFILFMLSFSLLAQIKSNNDILKIVLQKKTNEFKYEINFKKAQHFLLKKDWDSTLIYSMKQLSLNTNKEIADYCHYFRGTSFFNKKMHQAAQKELLQISTQFEFYPQSEILIASSSLELREFRNALIHYKNALEQPSIQKQPYSLAKIYEGLGTTYIFVEKYDKAEEYLFKNLDIKEKHKFNLFQSYNSIANLYYNQYKDQLAIPFFEKAYVLAKNGKDVSHKKLAAKNMAVVEENRGNYKKALVYNKEFDKWKDSLSNQNKIWAVADFEKKFAVAQKQKQIKVLYVENKLKSTQRNNLFFASMGLLVLLIGGVFVYGQKVKHTKIILLQKNKLDELNATKDQLFSIVSHDLRSSVNALKTSNIKLSASLETKNYNELDQLLINNNAIANSTYGLLDNLLHWAMLQTKQLYFKKESVHLYSVIQQVEYNYKPLLVEKEIAFENEVSKTSFVDADLDSVKIVLRNLLDNAIKFTPKNGMIKVYSQEISPDFWQLVIQDNGKGMSQNIIAELLSDSELLANKEGSERIGTGLGMQLCKQMIMKNNGKISIESEINKGTTVIILLPKTV